MFTKLNSLKEELRNNAIKASGVKSEHVSFFAEILDSAGIDSEEVMVSPALYKLVEVYDLVDGDIDEFTLLIDLLNGNHQKLVYILFTEKEISSMFYANNEGLDFFEPEAAVLYLNKTLDFLITNLKNGNTNVSDMEYFIDDLYEQVEQKSQEELSEDYF